MTPIRITVLDIVPSTNVRSTQGDKWLFRVDDDYLKEYDNRKLELTGKRGGNERRKRQLEKYNSFKQEIYNIAEKAMFTMPKGYFAVWFYVPMPSSWRKKKREAHLYQQHENMPDWDNFAKAAQDGMMPRKSRIKGEKGRDDRSIHCISVFKVWVETHEACIKILEYSKDDYMEQFKHGHPSFGK